MFSNEVLMLEPLPPIEGGLFHESRVGMKAHVQPMAVLDSIDRPLCFTIGIFNFVGATF